MLTNRRNFLTLVGVSLVPFAGYSFPVEECQIDLICKGEVVATAEGIPFQWASTLRAVFKPESLLQTDGAVLRRGVEEISRKDFLQINVPSSSTFELSWSISQEQAYRDHIMVHGRAPTRVT